MNLGYHPTPPLTPAPLAEPLPGQPRCPVVCAEPAAVPGPEGRSAPPPWPRRSRRHLRPARRGPRAPSCARGRPRHRSATAAAPALPEAEIANPGRARRQVDSGVTNGLGSREQVFAARQGLRVWMERGRAGSVGTRRAGGEGRAAGAIVRGSVRLCENPPQHPPLAVLSKRLRQLKVFSLEKRFHGHLRPPPSA